MAIQAPTRGEFEQPLWQIANRAIDEVGYECPEATRPALPKEIAAAATRLE